jgi:hypothetical protein
VNCTYISILTVWIDLKYWMYLKVANELLSQNGHEMNYMYCIGVLREWARTIIHAYQIWSGIPNWIDIILKVELSRYYIFIHCQTSLTVLSLGRIICGVNCMPRPHIAAIGFPSRISRVAFWKLSCPAYRLPFNQHCWCFLLNVIATCFQYYGLGVLMVALCCYLNNAAYRCSYST